jgi:putative tryptophan/tyrosine transport system substrate-binding protein
VAFVSRAALAADAIKARLPTMCGTRVYAVAGCLMSYGADFTERYHRAAYFVDRLLKGAKPADLPVEQPTSFQLVINLKTAKALGIEIPPSIVLRADEVIE